MSTYVEERKQAERRKTEPFHEVSDLDHGIEAYIERCRQRIPSFVSDNFSLEQTWKLQRPSLWFDLACAPINSAWALPHLAIHKAAESAERVGYPGLARWAKHLPRGITTGYQRQIERRICRDLLEWDLEHSAAALPQGLLNDPTLARALSELLHQFSSARAIVSDLFATVLTLGLSWLMMGNTSISLNGIAHGLARRNAHDRAASRFFLGKKAGSAFYNVFPPAVHESAIWTILIFLVAGLTVGAMACTILSEPIRKALGFHRHRLEVLLNEMERELIVVSHKKKAPAVARALPNSIPGGDSGSR